MKVFILLLALLSSTTSFARQYFQCSIPDFDSSDVMVINLQTPNEGTLFLSSGMQNPDTERILVKIEFEKVENEHHHFKVINQDGEGVVAIPSEVIGKPVDALTVNLIFAGYSFTYSCFSRIYND